MIHNIEYVQTLPEDQSGESENDASNDMGDSESFIPSSNSISSSDEDVPLSQLILRRQEGPTTVINKDLRSPSGVLWKVVAQTSSTMGRRGAHNIMKEQPGPTHYAKMRIDQQIRTAWRLLIDDAILRHIQKCTVAEAHKQIGNTNWTISLKELEQFISILYVRSVCGCRNVAVDDLWKKSWGIPFCAKTISRNRFKETMKFIRFDLRSERSSRMLTDKFALISEVWNRFIDNCKSCYKPGENVTIDEQLLPKKARCKFTQYMANKPDKFGIKFWLCVDVKSKYLLNGFPYLGIDESRSRNQSMGEYVVMRLMEPYLNKGRNVTTDNFFTSVSLAQNLLSKKISLVGTVNRARRDIPSYVKNLKLNLHSTETLKTENNQCLLTVYQTKRHKNVLLLSTLHDSVQIDQGSRKRKPNIVTFYNNTKYGVDVVDQMARIYSTKSGSRRWPVQVFFNILDLAVINAWVLYKEVL